RSGDEMTPEQFIVLALPGLPLVAAVLIWLLGPNNGPAIRSISTFVSVVCLILAAFLAYRYMQLPRPAVDTSSPQTFSPEFVPGQAPVTTENASKPKTTTWNIIPFGNGAVQFYMGVDGLNIWLVVLTAVLIMPCVLVSFEAITERAHEYYAWLML